MPIAIVGWAHWEQAGLLTKVKKELRNHLHQKKKGGVSSGNEP